MFSSDDAKAVVRDYVAALQSRDTEAVRASFAEDATWTLAAGDLPIAGTWSGRDAILDDFLAAALSYYEPESVEFEVTGMIGDGARVVLQWTSRARTRRGRDYVNDCIGVFTVEDGRIQSVREYMDTLYAAETAFADA
ncbi:MAG TPA: nuclear transport factor 2 family protein [Thermoleophilaceae bacterium]|nr:nuclear transport factor 2 family protein [Thermoleophilaceae bacterium]